MPTYSYRCTKCERVFDAFHSMNCTSTQYCPECGAAGTKLLSASSVIFKGSGFYSTDYRDTGYLEAKKKDVKEPAKLEAKPTTETAPQSTETSNSTVAKPEAKATTPAKDNSSKAVSKAAA
ncbi:MAG: zinc ribbon domain-containing protein [Candidatus Riflebacteria bacterium]|nr:zinc ribbon domain-containing protein [Candidatus Riflebacteria bacterium]